MQRITRLGSHSWLAMAAVVGLVLGLLGGTALAAQMARPGTSTPLMAPDGTVNEHTIAVSGTGSVFVTPDVADVSLGVMIQRDNLKAARNEAADKMAAIIAALKSLGIADEDIRTAMLDVSPTYDYNSNTPKVTGYQVSNIVSVHVRDLDKLGDVIDNTIAAGANNVSGISFDLADRTTVENQAREAAVHDARARADTLAAAAGVTISGVQSISESYSNPWPWYGAEPGRVDAGQDVATPVMPGQNEITISVSISYLIG